jgi:hypothetical protein
MKSRLTYAAFAAVICAASGNAATINFENLADGAIVTNQYAAQGVTFSSTGGESIVISAQSGYLSTPPNIICTGSPSIDCTHEVILDFLAPVSNLQFDAVGNQNAIGSSFATIDVFQSNALTATFKLLVSHGNFQADHQNLSAYNGITRIRIYNNTDPAGTGYDTFSFNAAGVGTPEPSTFALLGLAAVALGVVRRRQRV